MALGSQAGLSAVDAQHLIDVAESTAEALQWVTREYPFGVEIAVFKVGGKMFLYTTPDEDSPIATLKCGPDDAQGLVASFPEITAGYHMNKKHWITLAAGPGLEEDLVADLVKNSYILVARSLPKARRPLLGAVRFSDGGTGEE